MDIINKLKSLDRKYCIKKEDDDFLLILMVNNCNTNTIVIHDYELKYYPNYIKYIKELMQEMGFSEVDIPKDEIKDFDELDKDIQKTLCDLDCDYELKYLRYLNNKCLKIYIIKNIKTICETIVNIDEIDKLTCYCKILEELNFKEEYYLNL